MALGGKKREQHRQQAMRQLEQQLDHLHASKAEREAARRAFRTLNAGSSPPTLHVCVRRSVGVVVRSRKAGATSPGSSE